MSQNNHFTLLTSSVAQNSKCHSTDDFSLFHNFWDLWWEDSKAEVQIYLQACLEVHADCPLSLELSAEALNWNTHVLPLHGVWASSRHRCLGWIRLLTWGLRVPRWMFWLTRQKPPHLSTSGLRTHTASLSLHFDCYKQAKNPAGIVGKWNLPQVLISWYVFLFVDIRPLYVSHTNNLLYVKWEDHILFH